MLVFSFKGFGIDFFGEAVIFAVFAAIGFILLGSKKIKPFVGYLMLLISISYTLKSASLFMGDTIITRVSDELLLLLSYVSAVFLGQVFFGQRKQGYPQKAFVFCFRLRLPFRMRLFGGIYCADYRRRVYERAYGAAPGFGNRNNYHSVYRYFYPLRQKNDAFGNG